MATQPQSDRKRQFLKASGLLLAAAAFPAAAQDNVPSQTTEVDGVGTAYVNTSSPDTFACDATIRGVSYVEETAVINVDYNNNATNYNGAIGDIVGDACEFLELPENMRSSAWLNNSDNTIVAYNAYPFGHTYVYGRGGIDTLMLPGVYDPAHFVQRGTAIDARRPNADGDNVRTIFQNIERVVFEDGTIVGITDGQAASMTVLNGDENLAPFAYDDAFTLKQGETRSGLSVFDDNGFGEDYDPNNGESFTATEMTVVTPSGNRFELAEDGSLNITADSIFEGEDIRFTYTITDARGAQDTATVRLTVEPEVVIPEITDTQLIGLAYVATENPETFPCASHGGASAVSFAGSTSVINFDMQNRITRYGDAQGDVNEGCPNVMLPLSVRSSSWLDNQDNIAVSYNNSPVGHTSINGRGGYDILMLPGTYNRADFVQRGTAIDAHRDGVRTIFQNFEELQFPDGTRVSITGGDVNSLTVLSGGGEPNLPPVANDDEYTVAQGAVLLENVLANDTDPNEGDTLTANEVIGVTNLGNEFSIAENGFLTFEAENPGVDKFSYIAKDPEGLESSATVEVTVEEPVDPLEFDIESIASTTINPLESIQTQIPNNIWQPLQFPDIAKVVTFQEIFTGPEGLDATQYGASWAIRSGDGARIMGLDESPQGNEAYLIYNVADAAIEIDTAYAIPTGQPVIDDPACLSLTQCQSYSIEATEAPVLVEVQNSGEIMFESEITFQGGSNCSQYGQPACQLSDALNEQLITDFNMFSSDGVFEMPPASLQNENIIKLNPNGTPLRMLVPESQAYCAFPASPQ